MIQIKPYMVFQSDIENYRSTNENGQPIVTFEPGDNPDPISDLVNYNLDESIGPNVFVPQNMTLGADNEGLSHSIRITEDKFATGNTDLVNNKPYYFMVVAYAHNDYIKYAADTPFNNSDPYAASSLGQKKPI